MALWPKEKDSRDLLDPRGRCYPQHPMGLSPVEDSGGSLTLRKPSLPLDCAHIGENLARVGCPATLLALASLSRKWLIPEAPCPKLIQ